MFFITEASNLYFDLDLENFGKTDQFEITLFIDTEGESINALETKIIYPADLLRLLKIDEGNSIINFWVEKPKNKEGIIYLSGVIPGGFGGLLKSSSQKKYSGEIITLIFETLKEGDGSVSSQNTQILLNDGLGTATSVSQTSFFFNILDYIGNKKIVVSEDLILPEEFKLEISNDKSVFDGKYFLVFYTQDKDSGISYYKVKEGKQNFEIAESPYLLKNQKLDEKIVVQVIDKAGNKREVSLDAVNKKQIFFDLKFWLIVIFLLFLILWKNKKIK